MQRKKYVQSKKKGKELYSKRRYPKVMYKNNPQIQKKEIVKKGKRNMILLNEFADVIH